MGLEPIATALITDWVIKVRRGGASSVPEAWLCRVRVQVNNFVVAEAAREVNLGSFWEGETGGCYVPGVYTGARQTKTNALSFNFVRLHGR